MPGLSIVFNKVKKPNNSYKLEEILNSQNYLEGYKSEVLLNNDLLFIGVNKHDKYPINILNIKNYTIILEGQIYNKNNDDLRKEFEEIIGLFETHKIYSYLKNWILSTDGDFIIYFIDNSNNQIFILNDIFGRLPIYYQKNNEDVTAVSRYLNFINKVFDTAKVDNMAVAQFLLMGYVINKRTLYSGINQLRPASFLKVQENKVEEKSIYQFNFDNKKYENVNFKDNIKNLSELFSKACLDRFSDDSKNIVTLSGGLDSRAVASCMFKNQIPFTAATIRYKNGSSEVEEKIAVDLSKIYKSKCEIIEIDLPTGKDVLSLLNIKEGMNSISTAQMLPFYAEIERLFGKDINFITGDNGDKIIFTLNEKMKKFSNIEFLADFIIREHSIIDLETINRLTGISKDEIISEFIEVLNLFPEENLSQKYVHFRSIEKPYKYAFQGEDRHRHFFNNKTPFWSVPFFEYIMNCSDHSKIKHRLFRALLNSFSPEATSVPYSNFRSSVNSLRGKLFMFTVYNIYPLVPSILKGELKARFFGGNPVIDPESTALKCLKEQLSKNIFSDYLNIEDIDSLKSFRKVILMNILSMTSEIELTRKNESTLNNYLNKVF